MTNLDRVLKSRDITLPTKVCLVKAMVSPLVMYGFESWTVKKAERWRIDAFELWCWRRLLRVTWTSRRYNQSIVKEISPGWSLERLVLKLKLQYFGHLMWTVDSFEKILMLGRIGGWRRRGRQKIRLNGITDSTDMSLSKHQELVMDRDAWCSVIHGVAKSWTRLNDWTELSDCIYLGVYIYIYMFQKSDISWYNYYSLLSTILKYVTLKNVVLQINNPIPLSIALYLTLIRSLTFTILKYFIIYRQLLFYSWLPWWLSVKEPSCQYRRHELEDPLEKETETHSSILTWDILWTEETGWLWSMGSVHGVPKCQT